MKTTNVTRKINLPPQFLDHLLLTSISISGNCPHPRNHVVGMFPETTGGKEECLVCRKVRYQSGKNGQWKGWK